MGSRDLQVLYMTLGGVSHYPKELNAARFIAKNIDSLCFRPKSPCEKNLPTSFTGMFEHAERYVVLIYTLASIPHGLTRKAIETATALSSGGTLTEAFS